MHALCGIEYGHRNGNNICSKSHRHTIEERSDDAAGWQNNTNNQQPLSMPSCQNGRVRINKIDIAAH